MADKLVKSAFLLINLVYEWYHFCGIIARITLFCVVRKITIIFT